MSSPKEAASWVASWKEYYATRHAGPVNLARRLRQTATEQRANLDGSRHSGFQGRKGRSAYEASVRMLEREASKAEGQAEVWRAADNARKAQEQQAREDIRVELMKKYPRTPR
jgi:hypothetical protein